jgi:hypothetical protein
MTTVIQEEGNKKDASHRALFGKEGQVKEKQAENKVPEFFPVKILQRKIAHNDRVEEAKQFITAFYVCNDFGMNGKSREKQGDN